MTKIKGTGMLIIRKLIADRGPEAEAALLPRLDTESMEIWKSTTLAISWVETALADKGTLLYEAAQVLFPGDSQNALREMGRVMAREGLPKFYQIFIRIPTPQFVFKRVAQLWRSFYAEGDASVEELEKSGAVFVLRNFPSYSANMRQYMVGYMYGMADLIGLKNMQVDVDDTDPQAWKWRMRWV